MTKYLQTKPGSLEEAVLISRGLITEARYMVTHDYGSRFGSSAYELSVVVSASSPHDAMKKGEDKLEKLAGTPKAEKLGIDELQDPNAKPEIKITDKPLSYTNMKKF